MTTVYATDIRRKRRVRVDGVVHYTASEGFQAENSTPRPWYTRQAENNTPRPWYTRQNSTPRPWSTRCGLDVSNTYREDLGDDDDIVTTCLACLGDRRLR